MGFETELFQGMLYLCFSCDNKVLWQQGNTSEDAAIIENNRSAE